MADISQEVEYQDPEVLPAPEGGSWTVSPVYAPERVELPPIPISQLPAEPQTNVLLPSLPSDPQAAMATGFMPHVAGPPTETDMPPPAIPEMAKHPSAPEIQPPESPVAMSAQIQAPEAPSVAPVQALAPPTPDVTFSPGGGSEGSLDATLSQLTTVISQLSSSMGQGAQGQPGMTPTSVPPPSVEQAAEGIQSAGIGEPAVFGMFQQQFNRQTLFTSGRIMQPGLYGGLR